MGKSTELPPIEPPVEPAPEEAPVKPRVYVSKGYLGGENPDAGDWYDF